MARHRAARRAPGGRALTSSAVGVPERALRHLRRSQGEMVALLMLGYAGYYLCRSNLSVALPLIADELVAGGLAPDTARVRLGEVASVGVLLYALGKFASGPLADRFGGRRAFSAGMLLSVVCTVGFALGGTLPVFTLAWAANRAVQSMGWPGLVKVASRWFSASSYARVMGVLSLSFLFGDAVARAFMGALLAGGASWRQVFGVAAAVLFALFVVAARRLREAPGEIGASEPSAHPENLFAAETDARLPFAARLRPLLASPAFWLVCALSLGMTLLRETFNTWTPTFLVDRAGLDEASAASWSAVFPLLGGVSVLAAGWLGDRVGARGRGLVMAGGLAATALALLGLSGLPEGSGPVRAVGLVAAVGFLLIGPYSYLAGAVSLDLGGKHGAATACGIIDGVGYLGGVLAGGGVARLSVQHGWAGAFAWLAAAAAATAVLAAFFGRRRPSPSR